MKSGGNVPKNILVVAAHPDDEVLGCGGTVRRLVDEGHSLYTLILGEGITSRDISRQREKRVKDISELKKMGEAANRLLGASRIFTHDFPDNRFDGVALLDIVKVIEDVKGEVKPDLVFTHWEGDLNIDHRITFQAVQTAFRPLPGDTLRDMYSFEVLSSSEWNATNVFAPDCFFNIEKTLDIKIAAMEKYVSEIRNYPHPRSSEGIRVNAQYRGMQSGMMLAEGFKTIRIIK